MLLQRGLDVNARDKGGLSPLLLAVRGRYLVAGTGGGAGRGAAWGRAWMALPPGGLRGACGHTASSGRAGGTEDTCFLEPRPLRPGPLVPAVTLPIVAGRRLGGLLRAGCLGRASWRWPPS